MHLPRRVCSFPAKQAVHRHGKRIPGLGRARFILGKARDVNAVSRSRPRPPDATKPPCYGRRVNGIDSGAVLMATTRQGRFAAMAAASVGLHALLIGYFALQRPTFAAREASSQVFDVTIVPQYMIAPPRNKPAPVRPRAARLQDETIPVAPLRMAPTTTSSPSRTAETPGPQTTPPTNDLNALSKALRSGGVGCRNQELAGLSREEQARCLERLGNGAQSAAYYRPGIDPRKQANLDAWGEKKSVQWKRDHEQITAFGHLTTDGGPTMVPIPDTNPTPKGPREIRVPF